MGRRSEHATARGLAPALLLLSTAYLATRLPQLSTWAPLLNDEAIALHRALLIQAEPAHLWLPNVEYKPPLFYWLVAALVRFAPSTVHAVRLVSVASGLGLMVVLAAPAWRKAGRAAALATGAVMVLAPWGLVYHRLGFTEPLLALFATAGVTLAAWPERQGSPLRASAAGVLLGMAFFVKQSALVFVPLPVLAVVAFARRDARAWLGLGALLACFSAFVGAFVLLPDVRSMWEGRPDASPLTYHASYTLPASELLRFPLAAWAANAQHVLEVLLDGLGPGLLAATALGALAAARPERRTLARPAYLLLLPLVTYLLTARDLTGRGYMLAFALAPCALLTGEAAAWAAEVAERRRLLRPGLAAAALVTLALAPALPRSVALLTRPLEALRVSRERILARPALSELAVADAAAWLRAQAEREPLTVLTDLSFGMPNDGLAVLLHGEPRVRVLAAWWIPEPQVPLVPDRPIEVHLSNHHRTLPPVRLRPEELGARRLLWVVNSLQYPPEDVAERAGRPLPLAARFAADDGSTLDAWEIPR